MSPEGAPLPHEENQEIASLIETLSTAGRRLTALTGGEVDSVADSAGRTILLGHAQEQLRNSHAAKEAAILNSLGSHIAMLDRTGTILFVNDAWSRFARENGSRGSSDSVGSNYFRVCQGVEGPDTEGAAAACRGINAVLEGVTTNFSMEYPCHAPDVERWFLMTATPLAQEGGGGAVVMHLDISGRKRSEAELLHFEAAMDSVTDAIYVADRASMRYVHVNDAACRMQGKTRAELLAMGPAAVLGMAQSEVERIYDAVIAGNNDLEPVEVQRHRPDGSYFWIERRRNAVCLGGRWTIVSLVRDVTERKHAHDALQRSESFNRAVMDASLDCLVTVDHEGRIAEFNPAAVVTFGWTREEALGKALADLLVPERFREAHHRGFARHLATGERGVLGKRLEFSALRADGSEFPIELAIAAIEGTSKPMFAGFIRDITKRKEAEAKLRRLNRVHAVLSGINTLIVRVRGLDELFHDSCRIACDAGGLRMAMISLPVPGQATFAPAEWAGKDESLIVEVRRMLAVPELFEKTMIARAAREGIPVVSLDSRADPQLVLHSKYAEAGICSVAVLPLLVGGTVRGVLSLYSQEVGFFDAEEMKLLTELAGDIAFAIDHIGKQDLLDYLAYYDSLTGLANRTLFLERVAQSLGDATTGGFTPALLMIDIERFKAINDSLGRPAGDELLRQVAEVLTRAAGDVAKVSRLDSDRFALVQTNAKSEGEVAMCLESTINALLEHHFSLEGTELRIAVKVGVAVFPGDGNDADALFRNAEAALKKAKMSGERYLFHTQTMTDAVSSKLTLENRLRQALEKGEFVLHYQPKVSLASGKLTGGEALIRWNDPVTGLVPPGRFIPVLEETGLIYEVGRWALRQALGDYLRCKADGLPAVRIAVNVSPLQLRRRGFVEEIADIIAMDVNAAAGLELEITESVIMEDAQRSIACLERIRAMGVTIAIDDFGTGFSSLSYLARLPVDTLKIDRSFVVGMTQGPQGLALVSTIINLAHSLKLMVVAEGVETEEQSRLLTLLGCDEMQGFLHSRPVPTETFERHFLAEPGVPVAATLAARAT